MKTSFSLSLAPHLLLLLLGMLLASCQSSVPADTKASPRPNILLVITDDQSYPHTSAYGYPAVQTPGFDRIAREGALFTRAYAASPGCSPSRAALLTGRHCWQLEAAGTHASSFPAQYETYPDLLAAAGYVVGHTGKGWGPGNWEISGRLHNPAGPAWNEFETEVPAGIRKTNYAKNFEAFFQSRETDQPFCFWYGSSEPHRVFGAGEGLAAGKTLDQAEVPAFLPDRPEIRSDLLDYCFEIEWADQHLMRILALLEAAGELENTLIIMTSDNGMAFPRAKANVYEYGIHVPMAIRWGKQLPAGQDRKELISFVDLAPTILEAAGLPQPTSYSMAGKSLLPLLRGEETSERSAVYSSRERHSSVRYHSLGYPQRALRTKDYLYVRNFRPERWPAGAPQKYGEGSYATAEAVEQQQLGPMHDGYHDIDGCPTLDYLIENREDAEIGQYFHLAVDLRPGEEFFDLRSDSACLRNLATDPAYAEVLQTHRQQMEAYLRKTGDARILDGGDIWETYPRYSKLRYFPEPDWVKENPAAVPDMPWLDERTENR